MDNFNSGLQIGGVPSGVSVSVESPFGPVQNNSGYGGTTYSDGTYVSNEPTRYNSADASNGHSGILGTARNGADSVAPSAMRADTLVTIDHGIQVSAAVAESLGYLVKSVAGGYAPGPLAKTTANEAAFRAQEAAPDKAPQVVPQAGPEVFQGDAEANYQSIANGTDGATQATAIREWTTTGDVSPQTIGHLAREAGIEPSAMAQRIDAMRGAFATQAHAAIRAAGGNPEAVMAWADSDPKAFEALGNVMRDHIMSRSTKGYAGLVQTYMQGAAKRDPQAAAGLKFEGGVTVAFRDGKNVILNIPGMGNVSYEVAMRMGLAKVARG